MRWYGVRVLNVLNGLERNEERIDDVFIGTPRLLVIE